MLTCRRRSSRSALWQRSGHSELSHTQHNAMRSSSYTYINCQESHFSRGLRLLYDREYFFCANQKKTAEIVSAGHAWGLHRILWFFVRFLYVSFSLSVAVYLFSPPCAHSLSLSLPPSVCLSVGLSVCLTVRLSLFARIFSNTAHFQARVLRLNESCCHDVVSKRVAKDSRRELRDNLRED